MSLISWNCRGLGNPATVQMLLDIVHSKRPIVLFIMETKLSTVKMDKIRVTLGYDNLFTVDPVGLGGGLALFWKKETHLTITGFSRNYIDTTIKLENSPILWRYTGYYGCPERNKRKSSWDLVKHLSIQNTLPWILMGDFNDLLHPSEKIGRVQHPNWLIQGFPEAVEDAWKDNNTTQGNAATDVHWSKPQPGFLKLNVDAAINKQGSCMGFACVLTNEFGGFVAAKGTQWRGVFSPREAEAVAVREALSWLKSHNFDKVQIETDSLQVVQGINACKGDSSFHLILRDIKNLMSSFTHVFLSFTKRSANQAAHKLARQSVSIADQLEWFTHPPPIICNVLASDIIE
nr:uncharacterized protein LOC109186215 [Ipomoea batatas]